MWWFVRGIGARRTARRSYPLTPQRRTVLATRAGDPHRLTHWPLLQANTMADKRALSQRPHEVASVSVRCEEPRNRFHGCNPPFVSAPRRELVQAIPKLAVAWVARVVIHDGVDRRSLTCWKCRPAPKPAKAWLRLSVEQGMVLIDAAQPPEDAPTPTAPVKAR